MLWAKLATAVVAIFVRRLGDKIFLNVTPVETVAKAMVHTITDESSLLSRTPSIFLLSTALCYAVRRLNKYHGFLSVRVQRPTNGLSRRPSLITGELSRDSPRDLRSTRSTSTFCDIRTNRRQSRHRPWCERRKIKQNLLRTVQESVRSSQASTSNSSSDEYGSDSNNGTVLFNQQQNQKNNQSNQYNNCGPSKNDQDLLEDHHRPIQMCPSNNSLMCLKSSTSAMTMDQREQNNRRKLLHFREGYNQLGYGDISSNQRRSEQSMMNHLKRPRRMRTSRKTRSGKVYSIVV